MQKYKKIVYISPYIGENFYPKEHTKTEVFNIYKPSNIQKLRDEVNELSKYFNKHIPTDVFKKGRYKLDVAIYNEDISKVVTNEKKPAVKFNQLSWEGNYDYSLSPESIKKILDTYDADLVFFQYFQIQKHTGIWHTYGNQYKTTYISGPVDYITYYGYIYDKSGAKVFTTSTYGVKLGQLQEFEFKNHMFGKPTLEKIVIKEKIFYNNLLFDKYSYPSLLLKDGFNAGFFIPFANTSN